MLEKLSPRKRLVLGALAASACLSAISLWDPRGLRRLDRLRADIERQEQKNPKQLNGNVGLHPLDLAAVSSRALSASLRVTAGPQDPKTRRTQGNGVSPGIRVPALS